MQSHFDVNAKAFEESEGQEGFFVFKDDVNLFKRVVNKKDTESNGEYRVYCTQQSKGGTKLHNQLVACLPASKRLFLVGGSEKKNGEDPSKQCFELVRKQNAFVEEPACPLRSARVSFGVCVSESEGKKDGRIFIAGGSDGEPRSIKECDMYSVEEDKWNPLPDLNEARMSVSLVKTSDDQLFAVGGSAVKGTDCKELASIERLDLKKPAPERKWEVLNVSLSEGVASAGCFELRPSEKEARALLVLGGFRKGDFVKEVSRIVFKDNSQFAIEKGEELHEKDTFLMNGAEVHNAKDGEVYVNGKEYVHLYLLLTKKFAVKRFI